MKKIALGLFMVFSALFTALAMTQPVYAAHSSGINVEQDSTHQERWYVTKNGSRTGIFNNQGNAVSFGLDLSLIKGDLIGEMVEVTITFEDSGFTSSATNLYMTMDGFIWVSYYPGEIEIDFEGPLEYIGEPGQGISSGSTVYLVFNSFFDANRPAITGEENYVTSVDDLRPVSFFQSFLTAIDETDGDITDNIYIVSDDYTPNMSTLGKYEVVFGVKDNAGNETMLVSYINVVDITNPVITGNASVAEISYTQTYNISNFKSTLTVTDNYYTLTSSNITVLSDDYTSNKSVPGTYEIVFEVTDPSGNQGTFTKQVRVIDNVAPVFSGPTVITKPSNSILAVSEIQAQLTAHDAIEGSKTSQITVLSDGYTGNGNVVGSYDVVFQVQDSKGNKSTHTVTVNVVDNIAPIIYIKDGVSIILKANEVLTRSQIISILQVTGQVQNVTASTQFSFLIDEYQGNEETPGVYMMSVRATSASGNQSVHNMMINVLEADTDDDVTVEPVTLKWYEHVWNFVVGVWNFIVNVFVSIWNFVVGIFDWFVGLFTSSNEASLAYKFYNRL